MNNYFSFLLCDHKDKELINVYSNGLPLGVINRDGKFIQNKLFNQRLPFNTAEELVIYLGNIRRVIKESIEPGPAA